MTECSSHSPLPGKLVLIVGVFYGGRDYEAVLAEPEILGGSHEQQQCIAARAASSSAITVNNG